MDSKVGRFSTFSIGSFQCIDILKDIYGFVEVKIDQKAGFWSIFLEI
jgi:hypothetical protein